MQLARCVWPTQFTGIVTRFLCTQLPQMMEPQVLAARGLYLNGSLEPALRKAQEILRHTPEDFGVQLLICRCVCVWL
jgi:hypothetical protein